MIAKQSCIHPILKLFIIILLYTSTVLYLYKVANLAIFAKKQNTILVSIYQRKKKLVCWLFARVPAEMVFSGYTVVPTQGSKSICIMRFSPTNLGQSTGHWNRHPARWFLQGVWCSWCGSSKWSRWRLCPRSWSSRYPRWLCSENRRWLVTWKEIKIF